MQVLSSVSLVQQPPTCQVGLSSPSPQAPDRAQTSPELRGTWNPPSWGSGRPLTGWSPNPDSGGEVSKAAIVAWRPPGMGAEVRPVPPRRQGLPQIQARACRDLGPGTQGPSGHGVSSTGDREGEGQDMPPGGPPRSGTSPRAPPGLRTWPEPPPPAATTALPAPSASCAAAIFPLRVPAPALGPAPCASAQARAPSREISRCIRDGPAGHRSLRTRERH